MSYSLLDKRELSQAQDSGITKKLSVLKARGRKREEKGDRSSQELSY